jgi:aspartokinase/homoserine dehydrogenase 1
MKSLFLLHLGIGNVGKKLLTQIQKQEKYIFNTYGVQLRYLGLFNSKGGVYKKDGFDFNELEQVQKKLADRKGSETLEKALAEVRLPFVLIDTTNSELTVPFLKQALERGGSAVLSNKKPLALSQEIFDTLHRLGKQRFLYETGVGAALPVIQTLKTLLETGDEVLEIQGCFSGTLGYLFSELEKGHAFSKAVLQAKKFGFIEPEPRDDLSGVDVARKVLILTRIMGKKMELSDIKLGSLYPKEMDSLTKEEFFQHLPELDAGYREKAEEAKKSGKVLRYLAKITPATYQVGLEAVDINSEIGELNGPDNVIVFKTKRYYENPITIKGPGAGGEVTAAGVFGDILTIVKML